ncbi:MAG: hypothetical protein OHK0039_04670 [Bacteroidia bacterium]
MSYTIRLFLLFAVLTGLPVLGSTASQRLVATTSPSGQIEQQGRRTPATPSPWLKRTLRERDADWTLALIRLIASIIGFVFVPVIGSIAGIVISGMVLARYRSDPSSKTRQLAMAGLVVGITGLLISLGVIFLLVLATL